MVQVGTMAYDAEKFCPSTTVALMGSTLPKDAPDSLKAYTDGYMVDMKMTMGQNVAAGEAV